jgi:acetoin utilization protein AcuA
MNTNHLREISWQTAKGDICIRAFCTPEEIRQFSFDGQFGTHAHYKSLYTRRESLEKNAVDPDANVVLALENCDHIVGYGVLAHPDPGERWPQLGPGLMMEVKAIEVVRSWRSCGIAPGLIKMMLTHPRIEDQIVYLVGYSWTWDLDGSGKTAQQYRQMMIKLFEPFGFQELQTNEPNICLRPENIFMGRIGSNVSPEVQKQFKWLRFGIAP